MFNMLKKIAKKVLRKKSLISPSQYDQFVKKMDSGNFNFSIEEENKLIQLWHFNNSTVPIPTKLKRIFESQDAIYMNSIEAAELTFKLPYGIAYEQANKQEYEALIELTKTQNIQLENTSIIDAGCGFGGLLSCIHSQSPNSKFFGIECSQSAKKCLNKKNPWLNVAILNIQEDVSAISEILPEKADVIFCTEVLEHLQYPKQAILNLLSLKKPLGSLILTVPNGRSDTASQHINFWSFESWKIFISAICSNHKVQFLKTFSPNAPSGYNLCAIIQD